jgi:hypothetical protein
MDAGRIRPADKDASDILTWGAAALLAAEIEQRKSLDLNHAAPELESEVEIHARSLECRSQEWLDSHMWRKPGSGKTEESLQRSDSSGDTVKERI